MPLAQVAAGARIVISHANQYYELLKGVTGETITLIYNAAPSIKIQPSSDPAASTDAIQVNNNAGTVLAALTYDGKIEAADGTAALPGHTFDDDTDTGLYRSAANTLDVSAGGTRTATFDANGLTLQSKALLQAKGADVASAAALAIGTDGNYFAVTGTTTITSIATRQAGTVVALRFDGALTLTHNATSLILQGGVNLTTAAGDVLTFVSEGGGNWRELSRRLAVTSKTDRWYWSYDGTYAPSEVAVSGSGAVTAVAAVNTRFYTTGATSGSTAGGRNLFGNTSHFAVGKCRRIEFSIVFDQFDAATTAKVYITAENASAPADTPNHIGIKNVAGVVSFTTADGTTEQTTDITSFVTATKQHNYVVIHDGTTARLYIDGTLRATHSTNVPSNTMDGPLNFAPYITNSAAASKGLRIFHVLVESATS